MYIVTGGAGFIGSAMVWKLNTMGIENILVVDNLASTEKWKNLVNRRYTEYLHRRDFMQLIENSNNLDLFGEKIEAVIHMGACSATTELNADFLFANNLEYSKALCRFALLRRARFINASSASTYGDGSLGFDDDILALDDLRPLNIYGYSKHLFDLWARRNGFFNKITSLKFFNVYGPNEQHKNDMRSVVNKAFYQICETKTMRLFKSDRQDYPDGGQMRDFVYVKDCVDIIYWLLENPDVNGLFNVGTGTARTWNDLAASVFRAAGIAQNIEYIDMPGQLKGKYQYFTEARMERLRRAGYDKPMSTLEQGVADYVQNYLQSNDVYL